MLLAALCDAQHLKRRCCVRLATLLPYAAVAELRPVVLRPTLSSSLPFSSFPSTEVDEITLILSKKHARNQFWFSTR